MNDPTVSQGVSVSWQDDQPPVPETRRAQWLPRGHPGASRLVGAYRPAVASARASYDRSPTEPPNGTMEDALPVYGSSAISSDVDALASSISATPTPGDGCSFGPTLSATVCRSVGSILAPGRTCSRGRAGDSQLQRAPSALRT